MTAKEYLKQAHHLDAMIHCRLREIDYWKDLSGSVSGINYGSMPHNPNKPTDAPFVRCIEKMDEIQRDIEEKVTVLIKLRDEINLRINLLTDRDEQLILRYRYIDNCTWEEIAGFINVSIRTVHRIHGSALQHFPVPE